MQKLDGVLVEVKEEDLILLKNNPKEFWKDVTSIDYAAFKGLSLTEIEIPETVTEIGPHVFADCFNLKNVKLPKNLKKIESYCFYNCRQLKNVKLPHSVREVGEFAFADCFKLRDVKLSSNLEVMYENAFSNTAIKNIKLPKTLKLLGPFVFENSKLREIELPKGVVQINSLFRGCRNLTKIKIPDSVDTIGKFSFADCENLKSISIPKNVKKIDGFAFTRSGLTKVEILGEIDEIGQSAFSHCSHLNSIKLPNFIKVIRENAFNNCFALKKIDLPYGLEEIEKYAFERSGLERVDFPNTLKVINEGAFRECVKLKEINLEGEVEVDRFAFDGCINLQKVSIEKGVKLNSLAFEDSTIDELNCDVDTFNKKAFLNTVIKKINIFDGAQSITPNMFSSMRNVKNIVLPSSVENIFESAFSYCHDLEKITLGNNIKYLGDNAFLGSSKLQSINLPDGLNYIGNGCFSGCYRLTEIKIPETVKILGHNAFENCKALKSVTLPNNLTKIDDYTFQKCFELENINFPENLKQIGSDAFLKCKKLSNVTLPNGLEKIGESAFETTDISEIKIPDSVTQIGSFAFYRCNNLKEVQLSSGLERIPSSAFSDCGRLKNVTIPEGIKEIGYASFRNCKALSKIDLPNSIETIGSQAFEDTGISYLKINRKNVDVAADAFVNTPIKYVTIVGDEITFSEQPQKEGFAIPYEFYVELDDNGILNYFINKCSFKSFNNEMKPWLAQINEMSADDRKTFYKFAYILGCFSNEKLRDSNGKELEATKAQKRSSLLASILNSGALTVEDITQMFYEVSMSNYISDQAVKYISNLNGRKYVNIEFLKELDTEYKGIFVKVLSNFESVSKRRRTLNKETGLPETLPWETVFIQYFTENLYKNIQDKNADIAVVFHEKGVDQSVFDTASKLRDQAIQNNVPHHILGKEIKEKTILEQVEDVKNQTAEILGDSKQLLDDIYSQKFTFEFLDKYDPKNFIMGLYTSCCATISGYMYGADIAEKTVTEADVQNLVVRDANGEIIAKGTIYVNFKQGYAVFNDFEIEEKYKQDQLDSGYYSSSENTQAYKDRELIFKALMRGVNSFVAEYDKQHPDNPLKQVNVGMGYNRLKTQCERYEKETNNLTVPSEYKFQDANEVQHILYKRDENKVKENEIDIDVSKK